MAEYKRYQKLQKYYLGVPVEPAEYKEGELIGIKDYNSIEECEKDTPQITYNNWVTTTSDFLLANNGFTINSLGTDDEGLFHYTIEGAGTSLKLKPNSLVYSHYVDLSNVTNLRYMFDNNPDYIGGNFTGWNTSKITKMGSMFEDAKINAPLPNWDTSNVTSMGNLFAKSNIKVFPNWNMSKVTNTYYMFYNCKKLTEFRMDMSLVTSADNMFKGCTSLSDLYISNLKASTDISDCPLTDDSAHFIFFNLPYY